MNRKYSVFAYAAALQESRTEKNGRFCTSKRISQSFGSHAIFDDNLDRAAKPIRYLTIFGANRPTYDISRYFCATIMILIDIWFKRGIGHEAWTSTPLICECTAYDICGHVREQFWEAPNNSFLSTVRRHGNPRQEAASAGQRCDREEGEERETGTYCFIRR